MNDSRKKYHHGDLRQKLIEVSLAIIAEDGVSALSLRKAAKRAGVTHAAPYAHFADKDALIAAVKDEGFRELHDLLISHLAETESTPTARLRCLGDVYARFATEQPSKFQIMFRQNPGSTERMPYQETGKKIFQLLMEITNELVPNSQDPELNRGVALLAWSTIHGVCSLWIDGPLQLVARPHQQVEQLSNQLINLMIQFIKGADTQNLKLKELP